MSALTDLFSQIAGAIRAKNGTSETIPASQFPTKIAEIIAAPAVIKTVKLSGTYQNDALIGKTYVVCFMTQSSQKSPNSITENINIDFGTSNLELDVMQYAKDAQMLYSRSIYITIDPATGTLSGLPTNTKTFYTIIAW